MISSCQRLEAVDFPPVEFFSLSKLKCETMVTKDRNIFQAPDNYQKILCARFPHPSNEIIIVCKVLQVVHSIDVGYITPVSTATTPSTTSIITTTITTVVIVVKVRCIFTNENRCLNTVVIIRLLIQIFCLLLIFSNDLQAVWFFALPPQYQNSLLKRAIFLIFAFSLLLLS